MEQNTKKLLTKGLLQSEDLCQYILETSLYPREPEPLKELRHVTAGHPCARFATSPDAGQLMAMLLKLVNAKKTIEVGVFTGYSLLLTALTIPEDGKPENEGSFDFAFVDADKVNYWNYHERLMKLIKVGGLVVYDNTLRAGIVVMPDGLVPEFMKPGKQLTIELNKLLAADPRVQLSHASIGDGITICRRLY
ncbi:probable caffeoyl-CoA O-methyltransferase At4g26220 isoform X3 [Juglans microcarpa x Juglans regia]|uniref:probable caffeoyl-CoA O-methyltransferase At4g26220 isoform X3 n=1 Tax=Juglans microcarpa x Juglans regia TaxID=2249226 RepID=UPI001B7EAF21|nr:probable caffeoyl-CoA O-methyltransferase At4g26220 isoform X3 [Juglans microcarpa x Juglans regia]